MRYDLASGEIKILKPRDAAEIRRAEPLHDDLRRLVNSMRNVLVRKYPNEEDRRAARAKIVEELSAL